VGLIKTKARALYLISVTKAYLLSEKDASDSFAKESNTSNPILCLVCLYSEPIFPSPAIRYFKIQLGLKAWSGLFFCFFFFTFSVSRRFSTFCSCTFFGSFFSTLFFNFHAFGGNP